MAFELLAWTWMQLLTLEAAATLGNPKAPAPAVLRRVLYSLTRSALYTYGHFNDWLKRFQLPRIRLQNIVIQTGCLS